MGKGKAGQGAALSGFVCSSFGKAAAARLRTAEAQGCTPQRGGVRRKLDQSDILFFSGHHYARYGSPLLFDTIDLGAMSVNAPRVRLILVSSCAGLHSDALKGFRRRFPNAHIFGWVTASPLDQKGMMSKFIESIDEKIDINSESGMNGLTERWREYVESLAADKRSLVSPYGLGYATPKGEVAYYVRKNGVWKWVTTTAARAAPGGR